MKFNFSNVKELKIPVNGETKSVKQIVNKSDPSEPIIWKSGWTYTIKLGNYVTKVKYSIDNTNWTEIVSERTLNLEDEDTLYIQAVSYTDRPRDYQYTYTMVDYNFNVVRTNANDGEEVTVFRVAEPTINNYTLFGTFTNGDVVYYSPNPTGADQPITNANYGDEIVYVCMGKPGYKDGDRGVIKVNEKKFNLNITNLTATRDFGSAERIIWTLSVVQQDFINSWTYQINGGSTTTKTSSYDIENLDYADVVTITATNKECTEAPYYYGSPRGVGTVTFRGSSHSEYVVTHYVRSSKLVKEFSLSITTTNPSYGTYSVTRTASPYKGASLRELSSGATIYYGDVLVGTSQGNGESHASWDITSVVAPTVTSTGDSTTGTLTITNNDTNQCDRFSTLYYNRIDNVGGTAVGTRWYGGKLTQTGLNFSTRYFCSASKESNRYVYVDTADSGNYTGTNGVTNNVVANFSFSRTTHTESQTVYSSTVAQTIPARNKYTITWEYQDSYDHWTTATEDYYWGETPSRTKPSTVTSGDYRWYSFGWDDLSAVTENRTITAQYQKQYKVTINSTRCTCDYESGWNNANRTITWTANNNYSFEEGTTRVSTTTATLDSPGTYGASADYYYITISGTNCNADVATGYRRIGKEIIWTASSGNGDYYSFSDTKFTTIARETIAVGTQSYSKAASYIYWYIKVNASSCYVSAYGSGYYLQNSSVTSTWSVNNSNTQTFDSSQTISKTTTTKTWTVSKYGSISSPTVYTRLYKVTFSATNGSWAYGSFNVEYNTSASKSGTTVTVGNNSNTFNKNSDTAQYVYSGATVGTVPSKITQATTITGSATRSIHPYTLTINVSGSSYGWYEVKRTKSPQAGASTGVLSNGSTIYYGDVLTGSSGANGARYTDWDCTSADLTVPTVSVVDALYPTIKAIARNTVVANLYRRKWEGSYWGGWTHLSDTYGVAQPTSIYNDENLNWNTTYQYHVARYQNRNRYDRSASSSNYTGTSSVSGNVTASFSFSESGANLEQNWISGNPDTVDIATGSPKNQTVKFQVNGYWSGDGVVFMYQDGQYSYKSQRVTSSYNASVIGTKSTVTAQIKPNTDADGGYFYIWYRSGGSKYLGYRSRNQSIDIELDPYTYGTISVDLDHGSSC